MVRRIVGAQALYAIGALLRVINVYVSIGFIVLARINFAIAPVFAGVKTRCRLKLRARTC
jgi:hypothetical protein